MVVTCMEQAGGWRRLVGAHTHLEGVLLLARCRAGAWGLSGRGFVRGEAGSGGRAPISASSQCHGGARRPPAARPVRGLAAPAAQRGRRTAPHGYGLLHRTVAEPAHHTASAGGGSHPGAALRLAGRPRAHRALAGPAGPRPPGAEPQEGGVT